MSCLYILIMIMEWIYWLFGYNTETNTEFDFVLIEEPDDILFDYNNFAK